MSTSAIFIVILAALLVFGTLVVGLSVVLTANELRRHHFRVVQAWNQQNTSYVLGPIIANFLNDRRRFGARGNGTLALTQRDLRFARPASAREIIIGLDEVADAFTAQSFNNRRCNNAPFLVIKRKTGDLTGFQVRDADTWVKALNKLVDSPTAE
jgi:hypothetical protein